MDSAGIISGFYTVFLFLIKTKSSKSSPDRADILAMKWRDKGESGTERSYETENFCF